VLPDQVIPNTVTGAPLAGTEPLIAALGLSADTATVENANGIRGATRFIEGRPRFAAVASRFGAPRRSKCRRQMASFLVSGGAAVVVTDPSVIRTQ
jgi:hypothetical protein